MIQTARPFVTFQHIEDFMRYLIAAALLFSPVAVFAQGPPPAQTVTLPTSDVAHVIGYLHNGGTRMEADALADQLTQAAQADIAKQQAAKASPQPPETK